MVKTTIPQLKIVRDIVRDSFGLSEDAATKITAYTNINSPEKVADIIAGDLSSVPASAAALGISLQDTSQAKKGTPKKDAKTSKAKTAKNTRAKKTTGSIKDNSRKEPKTKKAIIQELKDNPPDINPDIIQADYIPGELPDNITTLIMDTIQAYCDKFNITDMSKERQPRWGAACYMVGVTIFKKSKILHDIPREKIQGGTIYDVAKVSKLCDIWGLLCKTFCKAPLIDDFSAFAGLSDAWLYAAGSQDQLTPARALLLQKLKNLQELGLSSLIVDGRQNPTGALAALNHWHGWTQTREIIHTNSGAAPAPAALPVFDGLSGLLEDKNPATGS